jgi:hypothetical protein
MRFYKERYKKVVMYKIINIALLLKEVIFTLILVPIVMIAEGRRKNSQAFAAGAELRLAPTEK